MVSASSTDQTRDPPSHARFIEPKVHVARLRTETFSQTFGQKQNTWFCTNYLPLKELWRLNTAVEIRFTKLLHWKKIMKQQASHTISPPSSKRFDKFKLSTSLQQSQQPVHCVVCPRCFWTAQLITTPAQALRKSFRHSVKSPSAVQNEQQIFFTRDKWNQLTFVNNLLKHVSGRNWSISALTITSPVKNNLGFWANLSVTNRRRLE